MKDWQIVISSYCGVEIMWCLYTLFKYHKLQKNKDFDFGKKFISVFFIVFLLVLAAMVAHLGYLSGSLAFGWPIFVVIGLMIFGVIVLDICKGKKS